MRVPVEHLVDLSKVAAPGRAATGREIRDALPPGWVLDEDGRTARSDLRLLFRRGWILVLGLVCFGAAALGLFGWSAPRGAGAWWRLGLALALVLLAGGIVAPLVTRSLQGRRRVQ